MNTRFKKILSSNLISGLAPGTTFEDFRSNYISSDADVVFSRPKKTKSRQHQSNRS